MKSKIIFSLFLILSLCSLPSSAQWTPSEGLDGMEVDDIEILDSIIFLTGEGGVYYRHIDDSIWLNNIPNEGVYSLEKTDSALFARGTYTFLRSLDFGETWQDVYYTCGHVSTMTTISNQLVISNGDSIFISDDLAETWNNMNFNFVDFSIHKLVGFDTVLYVIDTYEDSLLFTCDLGNTWTAITLTGMPTQYRWILDIVTYNDSLYAATNHGVFVFINNSIGWELRNDGLEESADVNDLDVFTDTLFCAGENGIFYLNNHFWEEFNNGLEISEFSCIRHFDNYQLAGSEWGIYQKLNNDEWSPIYNGLNHLDIEWLASFENTIWVCTNKGLFKSENLGGDFEHQYFEQYKECDQIVLTDSIFYLNSTKNGLFISRDFGDTWMDISGDYRGYQGIALGTDYIFYDAKDFMRADHSNYNWEPLPNWLAQANIWEQAALDSTLIVTVYNDASYVSFDNGDSFIETLSSPTYEIKVWNNSFYAISPYNQLQISHNGINWNLYSFPDDEWYAYLISINPEAIVVGGSLLGLTLYDLMLGISYDGGSNWIEISEGLPVPSWPVMNHLNMVDYRLFAAPSEKGLWYRDDLLLESEEVVEKVNSDIILYPNPVINTLNINFLSQGINKKQIKIYDINGKLVWQETINTKQTSLGLSSLKSGLYFLQFISEDGFTTRKFIKQ